MSVFQSEQLCDISHKWSKQNTNSDYHILGIHRTLYRDHIVTRQKLGIEGVVLSMAGSYACMSLIHLYQCRLLIKEKAKGIWNK